MKNSTIASIWPSTYTQVADRPDPRAIDLGALAQHRDRPDEIARLVDAESHRPGGVAQAMVAQVKQQGVEAGLGGTLRGML